ncbi:tRNA (adenosine(37)-N6)-threonylcarbamoyltransferase complex dimerization subunit type 1 TsaB [Acetobacteraceae bacterium KSS8]|uniref:tRNA (Adenosine(37)-N6)-threonylcarbamoyltransferase complex dimerization subunit type 1 TsaB n=1 Tax=Endosaccharibacter trunci TaxID=2812733 RepID=A0ABT1WBH2_9PROT|nr:tRNA (adenosine(37)-N6)-threonylcarbamoyltransferase complex dimerization subunit type 1 TsaB [Acetobacteraceae bacterium KSS8]
MLILALDGASASGAGFGLVRNGPDGLSLLRERRETGQGAAVRLPALLSAALDRKPDLIAAIVGPGSFTGLRATLALAHGLAAGTGAEVIGVSVGEALAPALLAFGTATPLWCVSQARRDRVFIEAIAGDGRVAAPVSVTLEALPDPGGAPVLAGDAAAVVGAILAGRGIGWTPGPSVAAPVAIAAAALRRRDGMLSPRDAQPLYVDPPEAKLPGARSPAARP